MKVSGNRALRKYRKIQSDASLQTFPTFSIKKRWRDFHHSVLIPGFGCILTSFPGIFLVHSQKMYFEESG